jgi:hypothetical protein
MSQTETIKAIDVVRRIRDDQARELSGKSEAEVIQFFRRAGETAKRAADEHLSHKTDSREGV